MGLLVNLEGFRKDRRRKKRYGDTRQLDLFECAGCEIMDKSMDIKAALINLQSLFSCTRKCNTKASLLLAARILGIVGLLLVSPPMAHPQQVYTDEDLKNYKAAPMADDADMKRTDKMNRANADISRSERIQELVRENMQVVSDERMNRREKCNRLRSNQRQIDELSHGETNGDSLAANARAKVYIEEYCRRY